MGKSGDKPLQKMAIADIAPGKHQRTSEVQGRPLSVYDYSHVLSPAHRDAGYKLVVRHAPHNVSEFHPEPWQDFEAALTHKGEAVGEITGDNYNVPKDTIEPHAQIRGSEHKGKGLGLAAYEALYRHANLNGIKTVRGGYHSQDAARVHSRLALKHGLDYESKSHNPSEFSGRGSFKPYEYTIKSEAKLAKMAIAAIPQGKSLGVYEDPKDPVDNGTLHDYSHVLTPEQRKSGYSLNVIHRPGADIKPEFRADLYHKTSPSKSIGSVIGMRVAGKAMEPHVRTALAHSHRGKGLGTAMYEAMYAHARHNGIKHIEGGIHSNDAARVHESLSRRHGMDYMRAANNESPFDEDDAWEDEYPNAPYKYAIKSELDLTKMAIADIKPGKKTKQKAAQDGFVRHDYSHVLSPQQRAAGFGLSVRSGKMRSQDPDQVVRASITHPDAQKLGDLEPGEAGFASGIVENGRYGATKAPGVHLLVGNTQVAPRHRGNSLGTALYEALFAHAKHKMGATHVSSDQPHSTSARGVHLAVARKHGLEYASEPNIPSMFPPAAGGKTRDQEVYNSKPKGDYDDKFGPYSYTLKSENAKKKDIARVALIVVLNESGKMLIGLRKDNDRYTLPGGHLDEGEEPTKGALREMLEETGLKPKEFSKLEARDIPGVRIHLFKAIVSDDSEPHSDNDPDDEVGAWSWVDIKDGIPKDIVESIHGPKDPGHNVLLDNFGFKKSEKDYADSWKLMAMAKMQTPPKFTKLGIENRAETPIIHTEQQLNLKAAQGAKIARDNIRSQFQPDDTQEDKDFYLTSGAEKEKRYVKQGLNGAVYTNPKFNVSFARDEAITHPNSVTRSPQSGMATKHHEDFHQSMRRVEMKYGPDARSNLAGNLWNAIDPDTRRTVEEYTDVRNAHIPKGNSREAEENIAILHNYLNNPQERATYHKYKGHNEEEAQLHGNSIKSAHKQIRTAARTADERWLQPRKPKLAFGELPPISGDVYEKSYHEPCSLVKAEADEIDRLLMHPSSAENSMALKMHGVQPKHIIRALQNPALAAQALAHPAMTADALSVHFKGKHPVSQLAALQHPLVNTGHLHQLLDNYDDSPSYPDMANAIVKHPQVDAELLDRIATVQHPDSELDSKAAALAHPLAHGLTLTDAVESHLANPQAPSLKALALVAAKHGNLPDEVKEKAWKKGDHHMRVALANSPSLPEAQAFDMMVNGHLPINHKEALLRFLIASHPGASKRILDTGAQDPDPIVKDAARTRIMGTKLNKTDFDSEIGEWLGKMAVRPEDLKSVAKVQDPAGAALVDHKPDLNSISASHAPSLESYKTHILNSPERVKREVIPKSEKEGITRKVIYKTPDGGKYMVKPYHEAAIGRTKNWNRHPHQGWAEMSNQALYHAAGLGDLHQTVHTLEHNMGPTREKEPALVVHMAPNMKFASTTPSHLIDFPSAPQHTVSQARRIAIMDYLTNNLDRHGGNLLKDPKGNLLAIDHSRSFQYLSNHANKWVGKRQIPRMQEDNIGSYMNNGPVKAIANEFGISPQGAVRSRYDQDMDRLDAWTPELEDWWGQVSPRVQEAMTKRLEQIKDPHVRDHIKRNFDARVSQLDDFAENGLANHGTDWYRSPVPIYQPHQTEDDY